MVVGALDEDIAEVILMSELFRLHFKGVSTTLATINQSIAIRLVFIDGQLQV